MRKKLHLMGQVWRAMGAQFALVLVIVLCAAYCVGYACVLPVDKWIKYQTYQGTGMENGAVFMANHALSWQWTMSDQDEPAGFREAVALIEEFADRAASIQERVWYGDEGELTLYVYNEALVRNIDLPGGVSRILLEAQNSGREGVGLLLDERLRPAFEVGDRIPNFTVRYEGPVIEAYVAGFIDPDMEFIYSTTGGSNLSINFMLSRYDGENYIALAMEQPDLPIRPGNTVCNPMLLFPKDGGEIGGKIEAWRDRLRECGLGEVMTFDEMRRQDLTRQFTGDDNVLGLMCLWSLVLLLVGLRGFTANVGQKLAVQASVYRLLGMRRGAWYAAIWWAYCIPILLALLLPLHSIMAVFAPTVGPACYPHMLLLFAALGILLIAPMLYSTGRACEQKRLSLAQAERGM